MQRNIILNTDSYKASHFLQYPEGTTRVSSYIEARGGEYDEAVFFGLQMFIKDYLSQRVTQDNVEEAAEVFAAHGVPFNREGWEYIVNELDGRLPIEIQAVPEGMMVPVSNVMAQVVNTDPNCAWLTSYMETALLRAIWYPVTVATVSRTCKAIIKEYLEQTADNTDGLPFKLHDFGARGVSSEESAAIGGIAHLVNFMGSDTLSGVMAARRYYGESMAAFSIPAAEHSTITSWGREGEADAYANMIKQFGGDGKLVAVVSDSYDLWNAIDRIWGEDLKAEVINNGGTVVVRPDSGDPVEVVNEALKRLMVRFGYEINSKGFKVLPPYIRVIQGDGVSTKTIKAILQRMKQNGYSADNVAFGMGGELLQKVNRDTMKFAMKASAIEVNGEWRDVYKDPITDQGKRSKRGRLAMVKAGSGVATIREDSMTNQENILQTVFKNGECVKAWTFAEVRAKADIA